MSTPEFEIHRAIVHSSDVTTGAAEVRIPSLLGAGQTVNIPTTGLTLIAGEWNVPSAGSSVFVAVSADRTQFLWLTGVTVPTDSDIDFTDNVTIGGDLTVDGDIDATHINSEFDGPVVLSIKNTSGSTIAKGSPVYATGSVGQSGAVEVSSSRADTSGTMPALGLTQVELAHNGEGHAVVLGVIDQVDTSTYTINDSLYVAPTGGLTNTRPTGSDELVQKIGRVVRVNQSTGEILVLGAGRTNDIPNGDLTLTSDAGNSNVVWTGATGPMGLEISPNGTLESALYYRTTPDAWSFENANGDDILTIDIPGENIGINNDNPLYNLDVNGSGRFSANGGAILTLQDTGATNTGGYIDFESSNGTTMGYVGFGNNDDLWIRNDQSGGNIFFRSGNGWRAYFNNVGHFLPYVNNSYDLGSSTLRWRNIYTQDLHLSNGIGDYTVVEGEEDLYLTNNLTGKAFKFALIEVDPSDVPVKSEVG